MRLLKIAHRRPPIVTRKFMSGHADAIFSVEPVPYPGNHTPSLRYSCRLAINRDLPTALAALDLFSVALCPILGAALVSESPRVDQRHARRVVHQLDNLIAPFGVLAIIPANDRAIIARPVLKRAYLSVSDEAKSTTT